MLFGRRKGSGETLWEIKKHIGAVSSELQVQYRKKMSAYDVIASGFYDSIGLYQYPTPKQKAIADGWIELLKIGYEPLPHDAIVEGTIIDSTAVVETIRQSGDALLTVINDILDFSKIEAGKMELEHQPFDLHDCVEGALDLLASKAAEKGLDLAYLIEPGVPDALFGDVTRLRQVLVNLLSNAIKFTEKGQITVFLEEKENEVICRVTDTGAGIAAEDLPKAFSKFQQFNRIEDPGEKLHPAQRVLNE
jgi:signal transduction histidine kinase